MPRTTRTTNTGTQIAKEADTKGKAPTDGESAAEEKANAPATPNVYTGNVLYVKPDVKGDPAHEYVQVMVRFVNGHEVEQTPVQTYPLKDASAKVGDLVCFEAKRLRPALDKDNKPMMMGDLPILKAAGTDREFRLKVLRTAGPEVQLETKGEIRSQGLKAKLAAVSPLMAKLLGVEAES